MGKEDGKEGVLIHTYRDADGGAALPGCPETISSAFGDSCFYADPSNGTSWVQLLVLSRNDLSLVSDTDLTCTAATGTPQEYDFDSGTTGKGCTAALSGTIAKLDDGDLVIAVNQPGIEADKTQQPPVGVGATLGGVGSNQGIGGPATWYNLPNQGVRQLPNAVRGTVSVIGVPTWKTGGVSLESAHPDQWGSGALTANVAINNYGVYAPLAPASSDIQAESPITKVVDQPASAWPAATKGQAAAFAAIGVAVGLGSDPRAQYYSTPSADNTSGHWAAEQNKLDKVNYEPSPDYSSSDFAAAKKEMGIEFGEVGDVDDYTATLAMPYKAAETNLWAAFNSVQDAVNHSTANAAGAEVTTTIGEVISSILEIAPVFGEAAHKIAAAVVGAYHLALALSNVGKPEDAPFSTQAAELASAITARLDTTSTEIQDRWRNIIVADADKLSTVALCTRAMEHSCPNSEDDNEGWHISANDSDTMGQIIKLGLQRELYATLVPVKYPQAMTLNQVSKAQFVQDGSAGGWCKPFGPFGKETGAYLYAPGGQAGYFLPIVLLNYDGVNPMSQEVFDRMFSPVDKGRNYEKGGLGMDEAAYVDANYGVNPSRGYHPPQYVNYNHYVKYLACGFVTGKKKS